MTAMLLLFAVLSSGAVLGCFILKKEYRFEEYAPVSCMAAMLWLFCFGLGGALKAGFWLLMAVCAAIYFLALLKGDWQKRKNFFTPGFYIYILLFISAIWINYGMIAHDWDEFSHWALVVKEMTMTDALPCSSVVRFTFYKSYPPAMPLFQYLMQKLGGGEYTEWLMYSAYQIFMLSFFMPFIGKTDLKKWYNWLFIPAMWLSPLLFFEKTYSTIFIDPFLGAVSGACIAMLALNENGTPLGRLFVFFGAATLTLTKDIGFALAIAVLAAFIIEEKTVKSLVSVLFAAVPKLLWMAALAANGVVRPTQGKINIASFFNVIAGREDSYRPQVFKAFFYVLARWYVWKLVLLLGFLFIALWLIMKKKHLWWLVLAQTVLYILGMLLMYMYVFGIEEACSLASFDRYICVILISAMTCLVLCSACLTTGNKAFLAVSIFAFSLILVPYDSLYSIISRRNVFLAHSVRDGIEQEYCAAVRSNYEPGSRIMFGSGSTATLEFFESRFILAPDYDIYWKE